MAPPDLLFELASLVASLRVADTSVDARRVAVRATARAARRSALVLRLEAGGPEVDGVALRAGEAAGAAELLQLLRDAGVRALHVRQHASARELAQLVGVLLRRQSGEAPSDLGEELAALRLWSVRVVAESAPSSASAPTGEATALVRGLDEARDDAARAALSGEVVDAVARGVIDAGDALLARMGDAIVPPLVERLATAVVFQERRRCVDALLAVRSGVHELMVALGRPEWYVVRNVALVLGELRAEIACRPLARTLTHPDPRVRTAAAMALEQIGTLPARRAILAALGDRAPEVRRLAARAAVDVARAGVPLGAAPLLHALAEEDDVDAAAELVSALTVLGSAEAREGLTQLATGRAGAPPDAVGRLAAMSALTAHRSAAGIRAPLRRARLSA